MSSTAPSLHRLPRVAQIAVQRARLTVVPRPRTANRAPRVPFVVLISAILLGGVIGLLLFNTSMQQASFRETALSQQARDLNAQQEALQLDLDQLRDPQRIAQKAQRMGMIIPAGTSGVLDLRSGKVSGHPTPAQGAGLPLGPVPARRPHAFSPKPVKVTVAPTTTSSGPSTNGTQQDEQTQQKQQKQQSGNRGAQHVKGATNGASTRVR